MAKAQYLGPYESPGVQYLIAEGLLAKEAEPPAYTRHSQLFVDSSGKRGVEEVVRTQHSVVWTRNGTIKRVFNLAVEGESILHAIPTTFSSKHPPTSEGDTLGFAEPSLVVVLKTQVHIFCLSGDTHVIPLSFEVARALPFSGGCLFQAASLVDRNTSNGSLRSNHRNAANADLPVSNLLRKNVSQDAQATKSSRRLPTYCITDLLSEIGLVAASQTRRPPDLHECSLLPPEEELLYISHDGELPLQFKNVCVAVSLNRSTSTFTVWHVNSASAQAPSEPVGKKAALYRKRQSSNIHERSRATSGRGPNEPVAESFGGLMQSFVEKEPKHQPSQLSNIEHLAAELGQDFEPGGVQTRSARRISSMLARTDLAPPTERSAFNDTALASRKSLSRTVRNEGSFGSFADRNSFGGRRSLHASTTIYSRATSFIDAVARESVGDSGLNLADFDDALGTLERHFEKKLLFVKIKSFACQEESKEAPLPHFRTILMPHPPGNDSEGSPRLQLSVCIHEQDPSVMTVVTIVAKYDGPPDTRGKWPELKATQVQKGTGIADACLVSERQVYRLVVVSKTSQQDNIFHLEAPWSASYRFDFPGAFPLGASFLSTALTTRQGDGTDDRTLTGTRAKFQRLSNASNLETFQVTDTNGKCQSLQISLTPTNRMTKTILRMCQYVLPGHLRDSMLVAYWEVNRWLSTQSDVEESDYASIAITLFTLAVPFINILQNKSATPSRKKKVSGPRPSSGSISSLDAWMDMERFEKTSMSRSVSSSAWTWLFPGQHPPHPEGSSKGSSNINGKHHETALNIMRCIDLTREFLQSPAGESMTGPEGYLPTAINQDRSIRRTALASIVVALHFLFEELKLEACFSQASNNDQSFLLAIMHQLAVWLRWEDWVSSLYLQLSSRLDSLLSWTFDRSVIDNLETPPAPFPPVSMFAYVSLKLRKEEIVYHTLTELVTQNKLATNDPLLTEAAALLPRTTTVLAAFSDNTNIIDVSTEQASKFLPDILIKACELYSKKSLPKEPETNLKGTKAAPKGRSNQSIGHQNHLAVRDVHTVCGQALDSEYASRWDVSSEVDRLAITKMIFDQDRRYQEASRLVNQSRAPEIEYEPQAGWSEADALEAQKLLTQYATRRTFAVVSGRGMMHFNARTPLLTEMVPRAQFSMQCIIRPRSGGEEAQSMTFNADRSMFTEDKVAWAFFHNGVSAGLTISREATFIDTSWIIYNKPTELTNRHAGFLLALGLNGHLKSLARWVAFKYLTPKHTMTSIGLLLGLAASYLGTADTLTTRLLSVHVTCLLPPGAAELNLSPLTQTTGIVGIGLLYCNTQHRRMSEVMLSEVESQEPEEASGDDNVLRDEGYRLAAGMALGMINLGQGHQLHGLHDMRVVERLLAIAVATKNVNIVQILDRATAGAVLAVMFIFMKTNDASVARKIDIPDTSNQYDYVRPDIFMLRTLARHLIMWDGIEPSFEYVEWALPRQYQHRIDFRIIKNLNTNDLAFYHIVAGICFAMSLRYAGSQRDDAKEVLLEYLDQFMRISSLPALNYDAKVTLSGIRNCLDILALSCSILMAGSGDLEVYRRLRSLHGRTDKDTPYGSHLAAHMAIGALFLSGGLGTFGNSNLAVAAMVMAFYPLFPTDVLDNRSHLQALRHLWVLAVEHRCLILRDDESGQVLGNIEVCLKMKSGDSMKMRTPGLMPDLDTVQTIEIASPSYWPVQQDLDLPANKDPQGTEKKPATTTTRTIRDAFKASSTGINITLHRRALYDKPDTDPFNTALSALNNIHSLSSHAPTSTSLPTSITSSTKPNPLDWLFSLPTLSHLDHAERALVLDSASQPQPKSNNTTSSSRTTLLHTTPVDTSLSLTLGTFGADHAAATMRKPLVADKLWQIRILLDYVDRLEAVQEGEDRSLAVTGGELKSANGQNWLRQEVIEKLRCKVWEMSQSAGGEAE